MVIAVLAIVGTLGAHAIYLSMASDKRAGEKVAALGLLEEGSAQVEAIAAEKWQNIFLLSKNTNYYALQSGGKWVTGTGTGTTTLNDINYLRNFVLQNVCRTSAKTITGTTDSNGVGTTCTGTVETDAHDPSTQKVTITISWSNGIPLTLPLYVTRWPNKVCAQTAWTTGGSSGVKSCPDSTYTASANITSGASLQLCSGGC
jgi:hypothetical protein